MYPTTPGSHQLQTIFGSGYVPEQHGEETRRYLPSFETGEYSVHWDEILKTLRQALSLR
jgi:hypothetical protein